MKKYKENVDGNSRSQWQRQVRPQENVTNGEKIHYRFDNDGNYTGTKEGIIRKNISKK